MKKNGFTLIELLAVIVILAIIALIATPIILGIINDAREESDERSVELYASAVKNAVASYQLKGEGAPKTFNDLNIQYDGDVECDIKELYEDGKFYLGGCSVNGGTKEYSYGIKLCTPNTTKATALVWQGNDDPSLETSYAREEVGLLASVDGAYTPGVAYTCNFIDDNKTNNMTFFVLSSTENDVTLIAGSNLGGTVAWCGDETKCKTNGIWDNTKGPITANAALSDRTSTWGKLTAEQKSTIKLPTKDQIEGAYEDPMPKWLYSHTTTPVAYGYWTASLDVGDSYSAWYVNCGGSVASNIVVNASDFGVRPVITLLKTQLQ